MIGSAYLHPESWKYGCRDLLRCLVNCSYGVIRGDEGGHDAAGIYWNEEGSSEREGVVSLCVSFAAGWG